MLFCMYWYFNVKMWSSKTLVNYSIAKKKKKKLIVYFCGRCCIIRSDIDLRSRDCAVLVTEHYIIKDFCLTIDFFGYWSFIMAGNNYNLAFRELISYIFLTFGS